MPDRLTVHIVDDDPAVRDSVSFLLETVDFVVFTYESAAAFLAQLATMRPGCLLTDIRMPDMDGLQLQQTLIARGAAIPVIMMTGHGDVPVAVQALKAGAVDFLEKPFSDEDLIAAVGNAAAQSRTLAAAEAEARAIVARFAALTPREQEVFAGLVAGKPNKVIAYDLGISARTVEVHRARVMEKMAARSLSELVRQSFAISQSKR
jgi:two-component system response regulator FixJ